MPKRYSLAELEARLFDVLERDQAAVVWTNVPMPPGSPRETVVERLGAGRVGGALPPLATESESFLQAPAGSGVPGELPRARSSAGKTSPARPDRPGRIGRGKA